MNFKRIGIMGAMLEEVSHLKSMMQDTHITRIAGREYFSGHLWGVDVILVLSGVGKVSAAMTATTLINSFDVNLIIFSGVAGGVQSHLNIGDVVIAQSLYQHDMDARPIAPRFQIPYTDKLLFKADDEITRHAVNATQRFILDIKHLIAIDVLNNFSIAKPRVHLGIIASGDQFIDNHAEHDGLKLECGSTVLAVDMESAAVAHVCEDFELPYIIFRTLSDAADSTAAVNFEKFVTQVASLYSLGIIKAFFDNVMAIEST